MKIFRDQGCLVGYTYENPVVDMGSLTHCGEVYCSHDHSVGLHRHEGYEFMYVISGTAYWQVGDTVFSQGPSELFWTLPHEPHLTADRKHQGYHKLWFGIRMADLGEQGRQADEVLRRLTAQGRRVISDANEMEAVIRGLVLQATSQRPACADVCLSYLRTFLSLVLQADAEGTRSGPSGDRRPLPYLVQRAIDFMGHHLRDALRLEQIAAASDTSVSQLCLHFRETVGMTPTAYYRRLRLEAARNELLQPEISVTQAAMDFGFSSSQHFSMVFRKEFGTTPQAWKRGAWRIAAAAASASRRGARTAPRATIPSSASRDEAGMTAGRASRRQRAGAARHAAEAGDPAVLPSHRRD